MNTTTAQRTIRKPDMSLLRNPPRSGATMQAAVNGPETPEPEHQQATGADEPEDDFVQKKSSLSFSKAFAIVLGIHVFVLGGFYCMNAVKSLRGPKYVGVAHPKEIVGESVEETDRKWLEQNPAGKLKASQASAKSADVKPPQASASNASSAKAAKSQPATARANPTPAAKASAHSLAANKNPGAPGNPKRVENAGSGQKQPPVAAGNTTPDTQPSSDSESPAWMERAQKMLASASPTPAAKAASPEQTVKTAPIETRKAIAIDPPVTKAATPSAEEVVPLTPEGKYTLQPGDSLYTVARKLHVPYQEIADANGIKDPRALEVGQNIIVPTRKITSL